MSRRTFVLALVLLSAAGAFAGCRSNRPSVPEAGLPDARPRGLAREPLTDEELSMDDAALRHRATVLRTHAIDTLELAYRTVEPGKGRSMFNVAIRDLENAQRIYFELMGHLPAHLQEPLEAEIQQVQKLLRRCYSDRPQLPIGAR